MTLTLEIPTDYEQADSEYRVKLRKAAAALYDAGLITPDQAANLGGLPLPNPSAGVPLRQGSPEWSALLRSVGEGRTGVVLPLEATSREAIYEDDMR